MTFSPTSPRSNTASPPTVRRLNFVLPRESWEVTPSNGKEAPSNIVVHNAKEGGKKRHNQ
jgi:hypothetical protein